MKKNTKYVTCTICGNRYAGVVPKGGDGSALRPRKHNLHVWLQPRSEVKVCPGSYMMAREYSNYPDIKERE